MEQFIIYHLEPFKILELVRQLLLEEIGMVQ